MLNLQKVKIELMIEGVKISQKVLAYLKKTIGEKFYNDDYVTTTGIMFEINNDLYVTSKISEKSKYTIKLKDNKFTLVFGTTKIPIKIWKPCNYMLEGKSRKNKYFLNCVNAHFDRARISPISGCNNHCVFCSMNGDKYKKNSIEKIDKALKIALEDKRITHILISGGSPKLDDLGYFTEVYEYFCKNYTNYDIDVMMTPRGFNSYIDDSQYLDYIKHLKEIGVKGLSINLELYNKNVCAKYCPEKFLIGRKKYFKFLKLASQVFGKGNVRSGLIVGLESQEDTLKAVEEICKCNVMPMLSPYFPYNNIGAAPSTEYLFEVLAKSEEITSKHNLQLAPLCKKCRHNTL